MYPYFCIILPSYTLLAFIGTFFSLFYIFFRLDKFKVRFTDFLIIFAVCILSGFLGAKALFIVTQIPQLIINFSFNTMIHIVLHSGYVFYGGLFGVLIALKVYAKISRYNELIIYNLITPAIPLFHVFGRIGCLFAGCCYGIELSVPIEIFNLHLDRLPTQVFEAVFEFILFTVIVFIDKKKENIDLLRIYLLSYAVFRFMNEFIRGDEIRGVFLELSTSQWISITILVYYTFITNVNKHEK